jgi:hypothetical protein
MNTPPLLFAEIYLCLLWLCLFVHRTLGAEPVDNLTNTNRSSQKELAWGPVAFDPRISSQVAYNDNIYTSRLQKQSDFIWSLQPGLLVLAGDKTPYAEARTLGQMLTRLNPGSYILTDAANWPAASLTLDYSPTINWYTKYRDNDAVNQAVWLQGMFPFAKLILGFEQTYDRRTDPMYEVGQQVQMDRIGTRLFTAYRFSEKTSSDVEFARDSITYGKSSGLRDNTEWSTHAWLNQQTTVKLNLSAGLALGMIEVPDWQSQTYEHLLLRARYNWSQRFSMEAITGMEIRQSQAGSGSLDPVFSTALRYSPFNRTSIIVTGRRGTTASVYSGLNNTTTGASLMLQQNFKDRYVAGFSTGYDFVEYGNVVSRQSVNQHDENFNVRLQFDVKFTKHLRGGLFAMHRLWNSNTSTSLDNNQTGVQLQWRY